MGLAKPIAQPQGVMVLFGVLALTKATRFFRGVAAMS